MEMDNYKGIKKLCSYTRNIPNGCYVQIFLDTKSMEVWGRCLVGDDFAVYHDNNIIAAGYTTEFKTQKELKEMISESFECYKQNQAFWAAALSK